MIKNIIKLGIIIFLVISGILSAIYFIKWTQKAPYVVDCIINDSNSKDKCLEEFIDSSPPMQEAYSIQEACDKSDTSCLAKTGQIIINRKMEETVK